MTVSIRLIKTYKQWLVTYSNKKAKKSKLPKQVFRHLFEQSGIRVSSHIIDNLIILNFNPMKYVELFLGNQENRDLGWLV
jgi:hypothetical protein